MSYSLVALMFSHGGLRLRITACVAVEGFTTDADAWTMKHLWLIVAQPGWSEAWASALVSDPDADPGADEAVITDGMILSAVQAIRAKHE